jgi:hypothetical protein
MPTPAPFRLDLSVLTLLARCDAWLIPHPDCQSHPYSVGFYVPREMVELLMQTVHHLPNPHPAMVAASPAVLHLLK